MNKQIDFNGLAQWFVGTNLADWAVSLPELLALIVAEGHGDLERWQNALGSLPVITEKKLDLATQCAILGKTDERQLTTALRGLMPWRKGPFCFGETVVDAEWRSDLKWARVAPHVELNNRTVLDVGCGNGYYGYRMLGQGARFVLGIDPNWLFLHQFLAFKHYAPELPIWQLPWTLEEFTPDLNWFDTVFSMGVLYHRRAPIDHLMQLKGALRVGGTLVLETLVIDGDAQAVLLPQDRYAQMRNVWFIPSVKALERWLERVGFRNIRCVDVSVTGIEEQRVTQWMAYQSLVDYLDPEDQTRTIEGHPAPMRAVLLAEK